MISTFDLLLLSIALAMDCFTVSMMSGVMLRRSINAAILRMALLFGVFQAAMPLAGWIGTAHFSQYLEAVDHWIAFGLLVFIGGKMIKESFDDNGEPSFNPLHLRTQLLLAVVVGYWLCVRFGRIVARRLRPELLGGLVLVFIGIKVLLSHLLTSY